MKPVHHFASVGRLGGLLLFLTLALPARAHIGSPNVFLEGQAGPYLVRIVIRPPGVIPGLAEISVRVNTNDIERVTVLPVRWNTGRQGAPRPDPALPVRGETNLFHGELWFMQGGAESVEVEVAGRAGSGRVIVPVNAVATRVLAMPANLGAILAAMGILLCALLISIVGTAVRESVLPWGSAPGFGRRWGSRVMMLMAALALGGFLWFGKRWWDKEAGDYRNNRLYRPLETTASVRMENGRPTLRLELTDEKFARSAPLVPDHGKLMHLFLVREPEMDAFAHLHPTKVNWKTFEVPVPPLPAGQYRVYADVTYETGLADTLTSTVQLLEPVNATERGANVPPLDSDDAWRVSELQGAAMARRSKLSDAHTLEWQADGDLVENREAQLRFIVRDDKGQTVQPTPYMGMPGHLILRRDDGTVFTHLHPSGSFSMAAQQLFELRSEGKAPLKVASAKDDPICKLPTLEESQAAWTRAYASDGGRISFPYAFPRPGRYRLWTQVKINGEVLTGVFDAEVKPAQ